jgi:hypothetical protein
MNDSSIYESGVLKKHTSIVCGPICLFMYSSNDNGCNHLGTNELVVIISYCWIVPGISMEWPSLSLLTNFSLNIFYQLWVYLLLLDFWFHFYGISFSILSLFIFICFFPLKWVSYRQKNSWILYFNPTSLSISFNYVSKWFTLRMTNESYVHIPVLFSNCFKYIAFCFAPY